MRNWSILLGLMPILVAALLLPVHTRETIAQILWEVRMQAGAPAPALLETALPSASQPVPTPVESSLLSAVRESTPTVAVPPFSADAAYPAPPITSTPAPYQAPATPDLWGTAPPTPEHGCSDWARWDQYTWQWVTEVYCW